jgi:hypothetical protein
MNGLLRNHIPHNAEKVAKASREDESMPDGVVERNTTAQIKSRAGSVE